MAQCFWNICGIEYSTVLFAGMGWRSCASALLTLLGANLLILGYCGAVTTVETGIDATGGLAAIGETVGVTAVGVDVVTSGAAGPLGTGSAHGCEVGV